MVEDFQHRGRESPILVNIARSGGSVAPDTLVRLSKVSVGFSYKSRS